MKHLGMLAAAMALGGSAFASEEPTKAPALDYDRKRSRLRIGARTPEKNARSKRIKAYKAQRAANRLRRKLED